MNDYKLTSGMEIHVELKTKSKIFSSSLNNYDSPANTNVNVIDLAYPGVLPTINKEVIELALKAALILNCNINKRMHFDRKNYFYPDNPKNYQITQFRTPIGVDGFIEIEVNGEVRKIGISDIHIEEDTCKSVHYNNASLLNFNRAGVPLVEIVTKPDVKTSEEAVLFLEKLREMLFYADISDVKIEQGSMRVDANVSVSKTDALGTKIEVKNIGSISNVGEVLKSEYDRQVSLLESGDTLREETRRLDESSKSTVLMRVKEVGNDYRYFPEPDIPFIELDDEYIENVRDSIPLLPAAMRNIYIASGINPVNANKIIQNRSIAEYLNGFLDANINLVIASNILLGDISAYLNKTNKNILDTTLTSERFINLVNKLNSGDINNKVFKDLLTDIVEKDLSIDEIIKSSGIEKMDDNTISSIIVDIISKNPDAVNDFKNGNDRSIKFLMGMVMKETKGSADPVLANRMLIEAINKLRI